MEKDMFLDILYHSQENGKLFPGMRSWSPGMSLRANNKTESKEETESEKKEIHKEVGKISFKLSDLFLGGLRLKEKSEKRQHNTRAPINCRF